MLDKNTNGMVCSLDSKIDFFDIVPVVFQGIALEP